MSIVQALLLSLIQSATEFLPVSSSGHLLFVKGVFGLMDIPLIFDVIVHLGSLIAIIVFYRRRLKKTIAGAWQGLIQKQFNHPELRWTIYLLIATFVTFIIYLLFGDQIESRFACPETLSITYIITTIVLALTYFARKKSILKLTELHWRWAIYIGLFQAMAMLPGVSRSGLTIAPLILMGLARKEAGYFAFGLAIPAILGACAYELTDSVQLVFVTTYPVMTIMSLIISAIASFMFLRLLNWVLARNTFWVFSIYTGILTVVCWIIFGI
ncbi:undecaprenyl-diphosphate phosphatase [bacterium]|nr:undecaprenyl-diphosphate phosphatase [bacterium]